ncbi:MAG: hypothetical protein K8S56_01625, partial [Candidatus Cloacimonetes bacterium]|nr:hypothetical protein [Candidatus Cloacimonadota bacterium]
MKRQGILLFVAILLIAGCSSPTRNSDETMYISTNSSELSSRITYVNEPIEVTNLDGENQRMDLTLVAEVANPVTPLAQEIHASFVFIHGDLVYVAYNKIGDEFAGGVDVIDCSDPTTPVIVSELLYTDADINALFVDFEAIGANRRLWLGGARDPVVANGPDMESPAIVEEIMLENGLITVNSTIDVYDVPSSSVNGVARSAAWLYTANGYTDGGAFCYSLATWDYMQEVESDRYDGAKFAAIDGIWN